MWINVQAGRAAYKKSAFKSLTTAAEVTSRRPRAVSTTSLRRYTVVKTGNPWMDSPPMLRDAHYFRALGVPFYYHATLRQVVTELRCTLSRTAGVSTSGD